MASDARGTRAAEFAINLAQIRALTYRERAAQLREMARTETVARVRDGLLILADQYDGLAARVGGDQPLSAITNQTETLLNVEITGRDLRERSPAAS